MDMVELHHDRDEKDLSITNDTKHAFQVIIWNLEDNEQQAVFLTVH